MRLVTFFGTGLLFAIGLAISGMTRPDKVVGFLDFTGAWDPALAFVMGGAVLVNIALFYPTIRRPKPVYAVKFALPTRTDLDLRLIGGAALFGIGWGLGGFCPGPGLASLTTLSAQALTFVGAMIGGMILFKYAQRALSARSETAGPAAPAASPRR